MKTHLHTSPIVVKIQTLFNTALGMSGAVKLMYAVELGSIVVVQELDRKLNY